MNDAADNLDRADQFSWLTAATGLFNRACGWAVTHKRPLKLFALIVALTLFCGGLLLSLRAHPDILDSIKLAPLLLILFGVLPAGLAVSAADFQLLARLSGVKIDFWRAAEVTIYTRAANMLPVPGSMALRMAILKGAGATFVRSGKLMLLFTAIWGGVSFSFSSVWLLFQKALGLGATFAAIGLTILMASAVIARDQKLPAKAVLGVACLRSAMVSLEALGLMMAVRAVGLDVQYHETAVLVVASFLSGLAQIGLGIQETILAILAPFGGIDSATGFLAGAAMRVTGMLFLAIAAGLALLAGWRRR